MLVAEVADKKRERESALNERAPPLKLSGLSVQELQVSLNISIILHLSIILNISIIHHIYNKIYSSISSILGGG